MIKIILMLLLLSGCALKGTGWTSSAYSRDLENYVGQSEMNLYQNWGAPDNVLQISPYSKVVSYTEYYSSPQGGQVPAYANDFNYSAMWQGYTTENPNDYYCTTSFTIQGGMVTNYSFNGDDCVAK